MGTRRSRAEWESLITELETSGQSVARFSARRGLKPRTLQWWRWNLDRTEPLTRHAKACVRLIPVDVIEPAATADMGNRAPIEISLGDVAVRVAVGTEPAYVASLIAALRARC
jgi:hypothetical protein